MKKSASKEINSFSKTQSTGRQSRLSNILQVFSPDSSLNDPAARHHNEKVGIPVFAKVYCEGSRGDVFAAVLRAVAHQGVATTKARFSPAFVDRLLGHVAGRRVS